MKYSFSYQAVSTSFSSSGRAFLNLLTVSALSAFNPLRHSSYKDKIQMSFSTDDLTTNMYKNIQIHIHIYKDIAWDLRNQYINSYTDNASANLYPCYYDTLNEDHNCIKKKKLMSTKLNVFLFKHTQKKKLLSTKLNVFLFTTLKFVTNRRDWKLIKMS